MLVGTIIAWANPLPPSKYIFCDGTVYPVGDYPVLAALLGAAFGGDGVTTFGVPDLRGRCVIGSGTGPGLSPRAFSLLDGEENHQLSEAELAAHSHDYTKADGTVQVTNDPEQIGVLQTSSGDSTQASGGDSPHNNMQPFCVLSYVIYTGQV